jgi:hypothetical protein
MLSHQINPMIPFDTPKGPGFAFWRTDYGQEHDTLYSIIITATGEVWDFPQSKIRGRQNISMGRVLAEPAMVRREVQSETSTNLLSELNRNHAAAMANTKASVHSSQSDNMLQEVLTRATNPAYAKATT